MRCGTTIRSIAGRYVTLTRSVVRPFVQNYDRGLGAALTVDRPHASTGSSQDSARGHAIGRTGRFQIVTARKEKNYDEIATAIIGGLSSSGRKLPKLLGVHVNDIRSFLDSLTKLNGLRVTITFRILFRSSFLREYAGKLAIWSI